MESNLSEQDPTVHVDGVNYKLSDYPLSFMADLRARNANDLGELCAELEALAYTPADAPALLEPLLSDWPSDFVEKFRADECFECGEHEVLDGLMERWPEMRFGRYIDLNIQQGFYLHVGDGKITLPTGSDSGHVIGALADLGVTIDQEGNPGWWASEAEKHYVSDGRAKLSWALEKATGPWLLTADLEEGRHEHWYWLVLRFLSDIDEAAFLAAFKEAGA